MVKSLKKNAVWNFIYTGTNILFPLITAPYVTRVLGAANLGEVDFAKSFVQWFLIFSSFGITTYGVRAISQVRDNQQKMNRIFSELFIINILFSIFASIMYMLVILNGNQFSNELPLFIIMTFSIILNAVNIDWFYQGIEEYNYITIRNFIIKIFSLVLIFIFIQNPNDYIIYGLISILATGLSGILNVINSRKYVQITFKSLNFMNHIKSRGVFFLTTFIINIYSNLDRTLLGFMDTSSSVAFLTMVKSVTNMGGSVATSIASVAMPRASYFLRSDFVRYRNLIREVPKLMQIFTIPLAVGIISLSSDVMYILGGEEFAEASGLLALVAVVVIFSSLSTFLSQQVLVPTGNENFGLIASIFSSIVSIVANLLLIPRFSYLGAGLALVLAEFTALTTRYIFTRKMRYDFIQIFSISSFKYIVSALTMIIPIYVVKLNVESLLISFGLSVILGALFYFVFLFILKEEVFMKYLKEVIEKIGTRMN